MRPLGDAMTRCTRAASDGTPPTEAEGTHPAFGSDTRVDASARLQRTQVRRSGTDFRRDAAVLSSVRYPGIHRLCRRFGALREDAGPRSWNPRVHGDLHGCHSRLRFHGASGTGSLRWGGWNVGVAAALLAALRKDRCPRLERLARTDEGETPLGHPVAGPPFCSGANRRVAIPAQLPHTLHGNLRGTNSPLPCNHPTSHSNASTSRGPGRLNI